MATCPTCRTHYPDGTATCPVEGATLLPDAAFHAADADLAPGQKVGEYEIVAKLGEGGFGTVYRAVHPLIGKAAAVKVLHRQYSSNPEMVSRFIAEARAVNQIRHRSIIDIFAFGALPDGRQYYVMELLEGAPFDRVLAERARLSVAEAIPILRSVARALDAAHQAGIAHRDLKPENIFLAMDDGQAFPKLLDFGIAKLLTDSVQTAQSARTRTGTPMGTPAFMSPEQCRGKNVDHRTDIYSFGVLTHKVLTGSLPFDGEDVIDILVKQTTVAAPPMSTVHPELPASLDAPVLHMLQKDPADRPPTVTAAVDELVRAAEAAGITVQHTPGWIPSPRASEGARVLVTPHLTPDQASQLESARTAVQVSGTTQITAASRTDGPPPSRGSRGPMIAVVVLAAAAVVGVLFLTRREPAPAPTAALATSVTPQQARDPAVVVAASSASSAPPVVAPAAPADEVEITVPTTPARADVYLAGQKLGAAPGPFRLPRGGARIKLTIKADGYLPKDVDVVPVASDSVPVTLSRPAAQSRPRGELENPF